MNTSHIQSKFAALGARLKVTEDAWQEYSIEIKQDHLGEFFHLSISPSARPRMDLQILQIRPQERHLLLLVRSENQGPRKDRFLCGHDERSWFVAAIPGRVSTIRDAKESLKPAEVLALQDQLALKPNLRQTRHNLAFRRQGEWFFVPVPEMVVNEKMVLRQEPIRRSGAQPHLVEQLYRDGGTRVYVCHRFQSGVTEQKYRQLIQENPLAQKWGWHLMQRDAAVYAKGAIRHPHHQTLTLPCWHRVLLSRESKAPGVGRLSFLD